MLTTEEKQYVIDRYAQYLGGQSSVRSVAVAFLPHELRISVPDASNPLTIAQYVIEICIADGWKRQPPALVSLLEPTIAITDQKIGEIVARVRPPPPPQADPLFATVLATGSPFINREKLRNCLRGFGDRNSLRPVMVINGTPKSGRSYSKELLEHFCSTTEFTLCYVKRASGSEPEHVARDLVTLVGGNLGDMPRREDTNEERWLQDLANWVLTGAAAAVARAREVRKFWFVLDGFGGPDLKKSVRDFIVHLADKITTGIYVKDFRLILLEFERTSLTLPIGRIVKDETTFVDDAEILKCVNSILATSKKLTVDDHPAFASRVTQDLPTGEDRMPTLNQRLQALLEVVGD